MNAKKIIAIILALVLCVGLLAGCGPKTPNTPSTPGTSDQPGTSDKPGTPATNEPSQGEVTEIVVQLINFGFTDPDLELVQNEINKISEAKIGVRVKFQTTPIFEMATKLGLAVSGNEQIDLVCTGLLTNPATLVSQGLLQPITEYVNNSEILSSKAGDLVKACTVNGEIYAYPGTYYPGQATGLLYDVDLANEYGIKMPERITAPSDLTNILEQVANSGMPCYGITIGDGANCDRNFGHAWDGLGDNFYASYGVIMDPINGTEVVNWFATPEYEAQVRLHQDWFNKGYVVTDSLSNGVTNTDSMAAGQAFCSVTVYSTGQGLDFFRTATGKNVGIIPITDGILTTDAVINNSWGVPVHSKNVEAAIKFAELINSDPAVGALYQYGIEGVHYVKQSDRVIRYADGIDAGSCPYGSFIPMFGDMMQLPVRAPLDESTYDLYQQMGPDAQTAKFLGYSFNPTNVAAQVTAVQAVIQKYGPALVVGAGDVDTMLPKFLAELEDAGINDIIAENQKQIDAWLAAQ